MLEPEQLNPNDVLYHLNALGFKSVTTQQLKDFIHDLKKLIKYEQRKAKLCFEEKNSNSQIHHIGCDCVSDEFEDDSNGRVVSDESCARSIASDSLTESYGSDDEKSECSKPSLSIHSSNLPKIPSSFIRPRNLPVNKQSSFKSKKNLDPVRLYHHYQEIWRQNKIPGQTNHSQLRWVIRNRMLGQD